MQHPTKFLEKLETSLQEARTIVRNVPTNESKTNLQHLKVQSFILLSHAAIEEYLEELGREVARESRRQLTQNGTITSSLVSLITTKVLDQVITREDKSKTEISNSIIEDIDSFSRDAVNLYENFLTDNHGIQEHNQKRILIPIGVSPEKVDVATMNAMNAYGRKRGDVAHSFSLIRTEHTLGAVESELTAIVGGLANYDKAACEALSLGMSKEALSP